MGNLPGVYDFFNKAWFKDSQTIWIVSDTHFSDAELREGMPQRPSDKELLRKINSKVGAKDVLIHLGDVGELQCVKDFYAHRRILILGNHDVGKTKYQRQIYTKDFPKSQYKMNEAIEAMALLYPSCRCHLRIFEDYWQVHADNCLFDEVIEGPLVLGEKLILSHEPINIPWALNIHGHVHDARAKNDRFHENCCLDFTNYEPVNFTHMLKNGPTSHIESLHRSTIGTATIKSKKRRSKK